MYLVNSDMCANGFFHRLWGERYINVDLITEIFIFTLQAANINIKLLLETAFKISNGERYKLWKINRTGIGKRIA